MGAESTVLMSAEALRDVEQRLARDIAEHYDVIGDVAFLGILRRGKTLADRLAERIRTMSGAAPRVGALATTLYRDDFRTGRGPETYDNRQTHFDFEIEGTEILLIDDVIAAGRTVRAAIEEVLAYGRPSRLQLAVLVDRRVRELPIQPDFSGWVLAPEEGAEGHVAVHLAELDGEDAVLLERTPIVDDDK